MGVSINKAQLLESLKAEQAQWEGLLSDIAVSSHDTARRRRGMVDQRHGGPLDGLASPVGGTILQAASRHE